MAKYRKKPVVVEAVQWHKPGDHPAVGSYAEGTTGGVNGFGWITTLEGEMVVRRGDWIITSVKGEHYPCKPDDFEATYEAVT